METFGIHKKSFPPLDSLVRPEYILQLVSLPGPSKVQDLETVTKLWQTINSPTSSHKDYERAVKRLASVFNLVKSAIKQGNMERVAIQDLVENLDLSVDPKACGICLASFQVGENKGETAKVEIMAPVSEFPILFPCGHVACYGCVTHWLRERSTCPCCDMEVGNVEEFKISMDSQVCRYDGELAEVLDLL